LPRKKTEIRIDGELCKGCGYCIEFCPKGVFEWSDEVNQKGVAPPRVKEGAECVGCGLCIMLCPEFALDEEKEEAA
jgi:2-oxoglutarate ferredoxin oxidoreductase subunit delta